MIYLFFFKNLKKIIELYIELKKIHYNNKTYSSDLYYSIFGNIN